MKKLREIRDILVAAVPSLKKNPDKLHIYIEQGGLACRASSLSFQYRYEVKIMVEDYTDAIDTLMIPVLAWVATHQPELLQNPDTAANVIRYEAEIIDHDRADVLITLDGITERVIVTEAGGIYTATHCDEPALPDLGGPSPWQIYVNNILIEDLQ